MMCKNGNVSVSYSWVKKIQKIPQPSLHPSCGCATLRKARKCRRTSMVDRFYIPHIVSYKPGTMEVATIWAAVAKSMTACPTIMGTGLRFHY